MNAIRAFADSVDRCLVVEEGDPYLVDAIRAAGITVEGKEEIHRFGELNVARVRQIVTGETTPETKPPPGKRPRFCPACPHKISFKAFADMDCIVCGDIGCYMLGVLPPFEIMDSSVCMGASIGVGLGLRHTLPEEDARRVVSVIGDSTFVHSGITGIVEMVYNPPTTGHVVVILDNSITAMTGFQENPSTGRSLDHSPTSKLSLEDLLEVLGVPNIHVIDPIDDKRNYLNTLQKALDSGELHVLIARRHCELVEPKIADWESCNAAAECSV
jgi:indolepyruvate ferredoxin oxidoreductase alpha subunit